ncbi:hypothetical protein PZN02_004763 [Sinorhizobium garamanticum]|uniref:Uncharacterized protein n=1 Tax=Sinorhizobium garamanticum TaxID=680247 RepID=A0ABY8DNI3_9HYPH|nr:hypothetical protein [Sinorhizobium garamanticum]WEX91135.1 hypothetical protein PZN02_004763 [Sinorhizobium garamanticum]
MLQNSPDSEGVNDDVREHGPASSAMSVPAAIGCHCFLARVVRVCPIKGRKIWNAELYRLEGFQPSGSSLNVDLSTIEVKEIHASHRFPGERDLGESYRPNNIFVASFIETNDEKFVFGRTNATR